ncbi:hypothetical protein AB3R30_17300 [Leptolyngbyaceae cyanobacterium UHCC 1019]
MDSANPLELAKQGDPAAISALLSYTLSQQYDATASVIRLGDYLSVFIETASSVEQEATVRLVYEVINELAMEEISTVEIKARHQGDRAILWAQTLEMPSQEASAFSLINTLPDSAIAQSSLSIEGSNVLATRSLTELKTQMGSTAQEDQSTLQAVLQRPEIVAMVAMALLLVFWDAYLEWMDEAETQSLSGRQLAYRLGVSSSTISRYKERTNFGEWSQALDPDGIAWSYTGKGFMRMANDE